MAVVRCVEGVTQEGAQQSCASCLLTALRGPMLSVPLTSVLWGFTSEVELMSLCSGVACAKARYAWVSLDLPFKHPHKKYFFCVCPELPFPHHRLVNHLKPKPSLRRTRAWCGSCWSSCDLAWTCHVWCCPPSSWSHAHSLTSSLITTTMPTCFPSKQHAEHAWHGHSACIYGNALQCEHGTGWAQFVCLVGLPDNTQVAEVSVNQARCQLQWPFRDGLRAGRGKENS